MALHSFDIECQFSFSEVDHAIDQAKRELKQRYDLKNTSASIDYLPQQVGIAVCADNEQHLRAVIDIIRAKLAKRNIPQSTLDESHPPTTTLAQTKQEILFVSKISADDAKKLKKRIVGSHPKTKVTIQGETVRVSAASKDMLQSVIAELRDSKLPYPLQFVNFR